MNPCMIDLRTTIIFVLVSSIINDANSQVVRGAYLQMGTQTSITIRWRTTAASDSRVRIGTSYVVSGLYPIVIDDASSDTEHIISVTGLTPDTKYYYSIGTTSSVQQVGPNNFFTTVPPATTSRKIKIIAFGDCGRGSVTYQDNNYANYQSFLSANNIDAPDAWLLLGDNAYSSGSDANYTANFFNIYGSNILKNHKLYPAPGNHDYGNLSANRGVVPRVMHYYDCFTTPQGGECGGVASGKPNFYSFDIGNIHFLSLDSWGIETDGTWMGTNGSSALKTWLDNDLAANTKKWIVAYWHHPPYTKSSHDSDNGSGGDPELPAIRQNFIGFLENRGVDLVICGHSHAYERSYLLRNFTASWSSFDAATNAASNSSAKYDGTINSCPYVYISTAANHGAVYVLAGSAGASGGTRTGFGDYEMPFAVNDAGLFYFEVDDNRLDAKMLRQNGTVFDQFTIMKDVNKISSYVVVNGSSQTLTASWPQQGGYTWSSVAGSSRSVTVTPPGNTTTNYTVTDAFGCITDQFSITTTATLPLSKVNYTARLSGDKVNIQWSTSSDINLKSFTIERSGDGRDFAILGTVDAVHFNNTQRYSFIDENPKAGSNYYRLMLTNTNNQTEYLDIKRIEYNTNKSFTAKTLSTTGKLLLQINTSTTGLYHIRVFDMSGKKYTNETFLINSGPVTKEINLPRGIYVWEITNKNGVSLSQKIIIQ